MLPEVAGRRETARHDDQHAIAEAFDLLEDVAAEEDRPALGGHLAQEVHHVQPLARVHAIERLVEDEHRWVVDERGGDLHALAHPLRVPADRAPGSVAQVDESDRPIRRADRVVERVEPSRGGDELQRR